VYENEHIMEDVKHVIESRIKLYDFEINHASWLKISDEEKARKKVKLIKLQNALSCLQ
jgi:hypothetical protein